MRRFDPDRLKAAAREMASEHGVEKTPDQWEAECRRMIADYRQAAREGGRPDIAAWPDARIWARIHALASGAATPGDLSE